MAEIKTALIISALRKHKLPVGFGQNPLGGFLVSEINDKKGRLDFITLGFNHEAERRRSLGEKEAAKEKQSFDLRASTALRLEGIPHRKSRIPGKFVIEAEDKVKVPKARRSKKQIRKKGKVKVAAHSRRFPKPEMKSVRK